MRPAGREELVELRAEGAPVRDQRLTPPIPKQPMREQGITNGCGWSPGWSPRPDCGGRRPPGGSFDPQVLVTVPERDELDPIAKEAGRLVQAALDNPTNR